MTTVAQPIIQAIDLHKRFPDGSGLQGLSFALQRGEAVGIIGPSGSGKTTLLRCLNLLVTPDAGQIQFQGETVFGNPVDGPILRDPSKLAALRRRVGMVFQHFNLWPDRTLLDNVALGPRHALREQPSVAKARAEYWLERVGLHHRKDSYPLELSGGQQQRVAIARALAMEPAVLLLDEPTSALDPELVDEVVSVIEGLRSSGLTFVLVTHQVELTRRVVDRLDFLSEGRLACSGKPNELLDNIRDPQLERFLATIRRAL